MYVCIMKHLFSKHGGNLASLLARQQHVRPHRRMNHSPLYQSRQAGFIESPPSHAQHRPRARLRAASVNPHDSYTPSQGPRRYHHDVRLASNYPSLPSPAPPPRQRSPVHHYPFVSSLPPAQPINSMSRRPPHHTLPTSHSSGFTPTQSSYKTWLPSGTSHNNVNHSRFRTPERPAYPLPSNKLPRSSSVSKFAYPTYDSPSYDSRVSIFCLR